MGFLIELPLFVVSCAAIVGMVGWSVYSDRKQKKAATSQPPTLEVKTPPRKGVVIGNDRFNVNFK